MQRSAMFVALAVSGAALWTGASRAQAQPVTARCSAAKINCASKRTIGFLLCHLRAEARGTALDPQCIAVADTGFSAPLTSMGCMEKAERRPCIRMGDAGTVATRVDGFLQSAVSVLDPQYPAPVLDRCGAGKKECVLRKVKALLSCYRKAADRGVAADPACLQKAQDSFDGGPQPAHGCFAKLEAKYPLTEPTPCQTFGDTGALEKLADDFALALSNALIFGNPHAILDFTLIAGGGVCGVTRDGSATLVKNLSCGSFDLGTGSSIQPEIPVPDGSTSRFMLDCTGSDCAVDPTATVPALNSADPDCTTTGCNFGTPFPMPNPAVIGLSTCAMNAWSAPADGTLNTATGSSVMSVMLTSDIYLTGNVIAPCPRCSATGSLDTPGTGTCDRGSRAGQACTSTNSQGLTRDCPSGGVGPGLPCTPGQYCVDGVHLSQVPLDLSPLTTATAQKTSATGLFCPGQTQAGCFGNPGCREITLTGSPAGPLLPGVGASATLVSVFCHPATGNGLVDAAVGLPAPGAESLPGIFTAIGFQ